MEDIETLDDWNAYDTACGCCPMPACPAPVLQCEIHALEIYPCGVQIASFLIPNKPSNCVILSQFFKTFVHTITYNRTKTVISSFGGITNTTTEVWESVCKTTDTYAYGTRPSSGSDSGSGMDGGGVTSSSSDDSRACYFTRLIEPGTAFSDYSYNYDYSGDPTDLPTGTKLTQNDHRTQSYHGDPVFNRHTGCESSNTISYHGAPSWTDHVHNRCPDCGPQGLGERLIEGTTITYTSTTHEHTGDTSNGTTDETAVSDSYEFSNPVTVGDLEAELNLRFAAWFYTGTPTGGGCSADRHLTLATCDTDSDSENESVSDGDETGLLDCPQALSASRMKYRHMIPIEHTGDIMNMDWQEVRFPEGYDPTDRSSPQPSRSEAVDKHYVWHGPASGDQSDPSWYTPWSNEISIDSGNGSIRIVNLRITCYNSPFGVKPQYIGEQYIWDDTDSDSDSDGD